MKKKGFTLIELLAVIVILAIIALIAVPIVLNMIESARKSGAKSSALGFIDAIEYNNGFAEAGQVGYTKIEDGNIDIGSILGLKMKGKYPDIGEVTIENGKVVNATLCINGYNVEYKNKDATINGTCDPSAVVKLDKIKLDVESISVTPNGTYQVEPIFEPTNATYKSISYSIKDTSIATISSTGLITGKKIGTTELTISGSNGKSLTVNVNVEKIVACKRATTLHTEECKRTKDGCYAAGYYASGSKETTTITYGSKGTKGTLSSGDAFDCDVTGKGNWERFYYITEKTTTTNNDTAVLLYYNNTKDGVANNTSSGGTQYDESDNWHGPRVVYTNLPSTTQWSNSLIIAPGTRQIVNYDGLTTSGNKTIQPFTYTDKAARLLTYVEASTACGSGGATIQFDNCNYFIENTSYSDSNLSLGYHLETPGDLGGRFSYVINGEKGNRFSSGAYYYATYYSARPVIEVLKSDMDY